MNWRFAIDDLRAAFECEGGVNMIDAQKSPVVIRQCFLTD